jgi:cobalt ECF transporter T component CbiQ
METLLRVVQKTLFAEDIARSSGLLQALDARVKLTGMAALIVSAVAVKHLWILAALFVIAVFLAVRSGVSLLMLARRIWVAVLAFTGIIAVPALFLVHGTPIYRLPILLWPISQQGATSAAFLVLRAETTATFALLLVLCTQWNRLLRALRFFRIPASVVFLLEMTYRYLFLFVQTAQDMIESRRARLFGILAPADERRLAAAMVGVLLDKSLHLSREVYLSMQARGFRGEVKLLDETRLQVGDWLRLTGFVSVALLAVWLGR